MNDFSKLPLGMDFMKEFWANSLAQMQSATAPSGAASAATSGAGNAALFQSLAQYLSPTLDPAELDKRLTDLKTVAGWLELNSKLLAQTIQTLEIQKATLANLHAMSQAHAPSSSAAATGNAKSSAQNNSFFDPAQWLQAFSQTMPKAPTSPKTPNQTNASGKAEQTNSKATKAGKASKAAKAPRKTSPTKKQS